MKEYVVGFLFSNDLKFVALIEKQRPDWQKGRYNGIGGKIEPVQENENFVSQETPYGAMVREFREETGLQFEDWCKFCSISGLESRGDFQGIGFKVHFFYGISEYGKLKIKQPTDEIPIVVATDDLPPNVLPNLKWLIPMALNQASGKEARCVFEITEIL